MRPEERRELTAKLLKQTSISPEILSRCNNDDNLLRLVLDAAASIYDYWHAPSNDWFYDYYRLTGQHMVETEEGWIPGKSNTFDATGGDTLDVLRVVNDPANN